MWQSRKEVHSPTVIIYIKKKFIHKRDKAKTGSCHKQIQINITSTTLEENSTISLIL